MKNLLRSLLCGLALCLALSASSPAEAQNLYNYTVTVSGSLGGAFDSEPDTSLNNSGFQAGFSLVTGRAQLFGVRLGQMDIEPDDGFGPFQSAELTYLTLAGEYRVQKAFYESGIFLGLGGYQLDPGALLPGIGGVDTDDDTSLGLTVGVTADFPITPRISILSELTGHLTDLSEAQFFGNLSVGVSFHF